MVMTILSFVLVIVGINGDKDKPSLFGPFGTLVSLLSLPVAYLGSMLMGAIFLITLPFALHSSASYDMGTLFMFLLPLGYLLAMKMSDLR